MKHPFAGGGWNEINESDGDFAMSPSLAIHKVTVAMQLHQLGCFVSSGNGLRVEQHFMRDGRIHREPIDHVIFLSGVFADTMCRIKLSQFLAPSGLPGVWLLRLSGRAVWWRNLLQGLRSPCEPGHATSRHSHARKRHASTAH